MLEYGQPLHAFDFAQAGAAAEIVVRRAASRASGCARSTAVDRTLDPEMLVIADAERAGRARRRDGRRRRARSRRRRRPSCSRRRTSTRSRSGAPRAALKLPSEASRRFEKGLPPELTVIALARAAQLLREVRRRRARGSARAGPTATRSRPRRGPSRCRCSEFERLLGRPYERAEVDGRARAARLRRSAAEGDDLQVVVPYRRVDVGDPGRRGRGGRARAGLRRAADDRAGRAAARPDAGRRAVPARGAAARHPGRLRAVRGDHLPLAERGAARAGQLRARTRRRWRASSTRALLPDGRADPARQPALDRVGADAHDRGRALLETVRDNLRWTDRDVQLFEIGRIYLRQPEGGELPEERRVLTIATGGYRSGPELGRAASRSTSTTSRASSSGRSSELGLPRARRAAGRALALPARPRGRADAAGAPRPGAGPARRARRGRAARSGAPSTSTSRSSWPRSTSSRVFAARAGLQPVRSLARYPAIFQDLALVLAEDVSAEQVRRRDPASRAAAGGRGVAVRRLPGRADRGRQAQPGLPDHLPVARADADRPGGRRGARADRGGARARGRARRCAGAEAGWGPSGGRRSSPSFLQSSPTTPVATGTSEIASARSTGIFPRRRLEGR